MKLESLKVPMLMAGIINVTIKIIDNTCHNDSFGNGCNNDAAKKIINKNK